MVCGETKPPGGSGEPHTTAAVSGLEAAMIHLWPLSSIPLDIVSYLPVICSLTTPVARNTARQQRMGNALNSNPPPALDLWAR